mgnify:CR=1 FL=1
MNIHEHQAKEILKEYGAPVSNGFVIFSSDEIKKKISKLKGKEYNDEYDRRLRLFRKAIGKDISPDQMHAAVYPLVSRTKKPFVPHKDVDVLEEFFGSEKMSEPFSPATNMPTYRDGLKSGNYILYENNTQYKLRKPAPIYLFRFKS